MYTYISTDKDKLVNFSAYVYPCYFTMISFRNRILKLRL